MKQFFVFFIALSISLSAYAEKETSTVSLLQIDYDAPSGVFAISNCGRANQEIQILRAQCEKLSEGKLIRMSDMPEHIQKELERFNNDTTHRIVNASLYVLRAGGYVVLLAGNVALLTATGFLGAMGREAAAHVILAAMATVDISTISLLFYEATSITPVENSFKKISAALDQLADRKADQILVQVDNRVVELLRR